MPCEYKNPYAGEELVPGHRGATGCQFESLGIVEDRDLSNTFGSQLCHLHWLIDYEATSHRSMKLDANYDVGKFNSWARRAVESMRNNVIDFTGVHFPANADLSIFLDASKPVLLAGVVFGGDANFDSKRIEPHVVFHDSVFVGSLSMREAHFNRFDFHSCKFHAGHRAPQARQIIFRSANFTELTFEQCQFPESVDFLGVEVLGKSNFRDLRFDNDANFGSCRFTGDAAFSKCRFNGNAGFTGSQFSAEATFDDCKFFGESDFSGRAFGGKAVFRACQFNGSAAFKDSAYVADAVFNVCKFSGDADFSGRTFERKSDFSNAQFERIAVFDRAKFHGEANFSDCSFLKPKDGDKAQASFHQTEFHGWSNFDKARFDGAADFSAAMFHRVSFKRTQFNNTVSFVNREFLASANFSGARFVKAPRFHGATLHQDSDFTGAKFEDTDSEHAARAYRTLKLDMEAKRARVEEARFFALEQKSLRRRADTPVNVKIISLLYEWGSNYGQSVVRPVALFIGLIVAFMGIYAGMIVSYGPQGYALALAEADFILAKNLFIVAVEPIVRPFSIWVGDYKTPFTEIAMTLKAAPLSLRLIAAVQSILSFALIALFLLALRRRFKME